MNFLIHSSTQSLHNLAFSYPDPQFPKYGITLKNLVVFYFSHFLFILTLFFWIDLKFRAPISSFSLQTALNNCIRLNKKGNAEWLIHVFLCIYIHIYAKIHICVYVYVHVHGGKKNLPMSQVRGLFCSISLFPMTYQMQAIQWASKANMDMRSVRTIVLCWE